jgi:hypothetical protein
MAFQIEKAKAFCPEALLWPYRGGAFNRIKEPRLSPALTGAMS